MHWRDEEYGTSSITAGYIRPSISRRSAGSCGGHNSGTTRRGVMYAGEDSLVA